MRFHQLKIPAYGPFSDFSLELPKGDTDFHLIYGPNEAGKSSLLRAIRALLFGIPGQTPDNFLHGYQQLRIEAALEDAEGITHTYQRRKGNVNTLLDKDGNPILEIELQRMLGVVDESYFDSMFGLGSEGLRQGADELLRGKGRLGEALFSASLGGTPVDRVIQTLEAEAGAFFAGRARRKIREALALHKEALKQKKAALIKPESWDEVERGLGEAVAKLEQLVGEKDKTAARKAWLVRCRDALPPVGRLAERQRQLDALPDLPDLPSSFAADIRDARLAWLAAGREIERKAEEMTRLQAQAGDCDPQPEVLDQEAAIDALHVGLGAYRDNKNALVSKRAEAQAKEEQVKNSCRDLGITVSIDDLEALRITQPQFAEAEENARRLKETEEAHAGTQDKMEARQKELARLRDEPAAGDPERLARLKKVIAAAKAFEATAADLPSKEKALGILERAMRDRHAALSGAPADLAATRALTLPSPSTLERFRDHFDEAKRAGADLDKEHRAALAAIRKLEVEIGRQERQRDLPRLEELETSRQHRDRGWELVLQDWKGPGAEEAFVDDQPLEEAYPEAVSAADLIADRLRTEAEAVAQLEELRSKLKLEQENLQALVTRADKGATESDELARRWETAWEDCHPEPATPREMKEWRETWREFAREWDQWTDDRELLESDRERVAEITKRLENALEVEDGEFQALLQRAEETAEELDEARVEAATTRRKIREAESTLEDLRQSLPGLEKERQAAQEEWNRCREALSLDQELTPKAQIDSLRTRREMFRDFDDWRALLGEVERLQERTRDYESGVDDLASKLGLAPGDTEIREQTLWSVLGKAKKIQATYDDLHARIAKLSEGQEAARAEVVRERAEFDALLLKAGLTDDAELDTFIAHFEERSGHQEKVEELRESLAGLSRGAPLDEFVQKIDEEDTENLDASISRLGEELAQMEEQIEEARSQKQEWDSRRRGIEAVNDEAARHDQEAVFAASRMQDDAERFVRLRVAIALLRDQIDTFREQNQGPFLERASRWFAELTGGAFSGIGTSFGDGDEPVIAGQRAVEEGTREVLVPGMSEGTRDQLYLALRLAGLELHLQEHEPMPMILDDLLVHFDDHRATNALRSLGRLAQRSQVLLFTHHAHLVELARTHLGAKDFHLHGL